MREVIGGADGTSGGEGERQSDKTNENAGNADSAVVERRGFIVVQSGEEAPCPIGRGWAALNPRGQRTGNDSNK